MRIGIITHYYKSENYGGNLQAWALCKVLERMGHRAEQISLNRFPGYPPILRFKMMVASLLRKLDVRMTKALRQRQKAFAHFNQGCIPHSRVYTEKTIRNCLNDYDVFITGSDQVWHPSAWCDAYLLRFVPSEKVKLSYAASVAHTTLTDEQRQRFKDALADYKSVSVREAETVELLKDLTCATVAWHLDPTMLLTKDDWMTLYSPCRIQDKFLFCYFLGDDVKEREAASAFAEKHGLRIVTIPNMNGYYRPCDASFGDERLYDVTPQEFLSLIKDAEYIFTDSYHATVFSLLFEKQHVVFQRAGHQAMATRLYTLVSLFETADHFCDTEAKTCLSYIDTLPEIDYTRSFDAYRDMKQASLDYLQENVSNALGC